MRLRLYDPRQAQLWRGFMPRAAEIPRRADANRYSVRIYEPGYSFGSPDMEAELETWAAVAVLSQEPLPEGMELLSLPGGLYAGFTYQGPASGFYQTAAYFFGEWLPASGYAADARPHYEVLGPGYRPDAADATEQVWIPVVPIP